MAGIRLEAVHKRYGRGAQSHAALQGVSLDVASGEFVALLGPSGSGKTTLLRAVAGLETLDSGRVWIGDEAVAGPGHHTPAERRNVGVVFQNHALWPHLSVRENVRFPLREAGVGDSESVSRALRALEQVELAELAARMPGQLSGGQKQRVSLARALVAQPRVVLFDEPLASLDVELRRGMMRHIAAARSPHSSMLYVTHNQDEALALADRVAVLDDGRIAQIDTPQVLCREPANAMVAQFVGGGNVLTVRPDGPAQQGRCPVELAGHRWLARAQSGALQGVHTSPHTLALSLAPYAVEAVPPDTPGALPLDVRHVFFQGHGHAVDALTPPDGDLPPQALQLQLPLGATSGGPPQRGQPLWVRIRDTWVLPQV